MATKLASSLATRLLLFTNPQKIAANLVPMSSNIPMVFPKANNMINQNDAESVKRVLSEGFLYPSGLPSLQFYLPQGTQNLYVRGVKPKSLATNTNCLSEPGEIGDGSSNEPMLLIKTTYQASNLRRKRNHGFLARKATVGGRRVIARRIAKGRVRITA